MKANWAGSALRFLPVFCVAMAPVIPAFGQAAPQVLRNPRVSSAVHVDISRPLSEMAAAVGPMGPPQGLHPASPVLHPKSGLLTPPRGSFEDPALQKHIGPLVSAAIGLNLLGIGVGFPNYSVPDAPTDANLAVGDTQVVQWVNVSYAVFDKTTGATIAGPIAGNAFWAGFGGPCEASNSGDPIVQWDKAAHRWVMSQNVFSSPFMTCVAISTTADATGTYYRFSFPQSAGFPDYPKWGIMPDAYYQSQNVFNASGTSYLGAGACAYERAKMLVGDTAAKQICFLTGLFDDSLLPADLDSAGTPPPAGQPEVYLGSIDNGASFINVYQYLFHVDFATPANSTFTGAGGTMPIPGVLPFSLACGGGSCIPQNGVTDLLDSLGDRLMYRLAYRNFSDHQTWLVNHSVTAGSTVGERWYEFRSAENSTSLSAFQQGTFAPSDNNYRWMGSMAMDQAQDIALGYSVSGSSMFPSIAYTGRLASDPAGAMQTEGTIVGGTGSQTGTSNRWGDYTGMALDAADDCTFWYTNQYYTATASFAWSTRLASFKFANCGSTAATTTTASSAPNASVFGQAVTFTSTTTSTSGTPVGTVTFTEGSTVWASNVPVDASGQASFTTNALSAGSHTITASFTGTGPWGNSSGNAPPQVVNSATTGTALHSSVSPSVSGQPVTFTAAVIVKAPGSGVPTGTVTFLNGATTLGTRTLNGSGKATLTTSALAVGSSSITAAYSGSASFNASTSAVLTQTVNKDSTTSSVTSSLNPSPLHQPVTFTATVTANAPGAGTPTGGVTFRDGAKALGKASLNASGQATFTTSSLSTGKHPITVVYGGNARFLTSTSSVLVQTVN